MDFEFSADEQLLQESIRSRVEQELIPIYIERSKQGGTEAALFIGSKFAEWGILGYGVPEELGGQGVDLSHTAVGIVGEELGRGSNSWAITWMGFYNWSKMLATTAPEPIRDKDLSRLLKGELFIPALFTEPHGGLGPG